MVFLSCTRTSTKHILPLTILGYTDARKKYHKNYMYKSSWVWTFGCPKHAEDSWIKTDQPDVTCFIISLFTAQHVSNVRTSIFRSLRLIAGLFHVLYCSGSMCVGVTVWFGWGGVVSLCRLKLYFNMFRMLVHPSSGACDLMRVYFMCCIALVRCVLVLRCGSAGVVWYPYAGWSCTSTCFEC